MYTWINNKTTLNNDYKISTFIYNFTRKKAKQKKQSKKDRQFYIKCDTEKMRYTNKKT